MPREPRPRTHLPYDWADQGALLRPRRNRQPRRNNMIGDKEAFGMGMVGGILVDGMISQTLDSIPNFAEEAGIAFGIAIVGGVAGVVLNRLFGPRR